MKKLEIYGTLGPACKEEDIIYSMFLNGMTGMRLNLSHVDLDDVKDWIDHFHSAALKANVKADLLIDMQGPELRIGKIEPIDLHDKEIVNIKRICPPDCVVSVLKTGQIILLDDGKIALRVMNDSLDCQVMQPGLLLPSKSIALPGISIDLPTLTERDIENIKVASQYGVTGLMQPFVRNKEDLIFVKKALKENHCEHIKLYAKIENLSGVKQIESFFPYCDHIIIARGDLGNAVTLPVLPSIQRKIEGICKEHAMPYMVVTEMLYSMQKNPTPTRAEVNDIYQAVYNGASSIMLTGETASGLYPVQAMKTFVDCANVALKDRNE